MKRQPWLIPFVTLGASLFLLAVGAGATMLDLGTLAGDYSGARANNESGWVVGASTTSRLLATHAFLYDGTMHDLGTLGGWTSTARGINNLGQVVGSSTIKGGNTHAFLYSAGKMTDLRDALAENRAKVAELAAEQEKLAPGTQKYIDVSKQIHELQGEYDGIIAKVGETAAAHEEAMCSEEAIRTLGGHLTKLIPIDIPGLAETRVLVVIDKVAQTPDFYVNGKHLEPFGVNELRKLVRDEVTAAYR